MAFGFTTKMIPNPTIATPNTKKPICKNELGGHRAIVSQPLPFEPEPRGASSRASHGIPAPRSVESDPDCDRRPVGVVR